jgi:hypothetical protein
MDRGEVSSSKSRILLLKKVGLLAFQAVCGHTFSRALKLTCEEKKKLSHHNLTDICLSPTANFGKIPFPGICPSLKQPLALSPSLRLTSICTEQKYCAQKNQNKHLEILSCAAFCGRYRLFSSCDLSFS